MSETIKDPSLISCINKQLHAKVFFWNDDALNEYIRKRAYLLWEQEGRPQGRALEFWVRAEQEARLYTRESAAKNEEIEQRSVVQIQEKDLLFKRIERIEAQNQSLLLKLELLLEDKKTQSKEVRDINAELRESQLKMEIKALKDDQTRLNEQISLLKSQLKDAEAELLIAKEENAKLRTANVPAATPPVEVKVSACGYDRERLRELRDFTLEAVKTKKWKNEYFVNGAFDAIGLFYRTILADEPRKEAD